MRENELGQTEVVKKTATMIGVSCTKLHKLIKNIVQLRKTRIDVGKTKTAISFIQNTLRNEVYNYYVKNEILVISLFQ